MDSRLDDVCRTVCRKCRCFLWRERLEAQNSLCVGSSISRNAATTDKSDSVRLAAHLYSEHLLDREHYMDWLSTSLESSPLAKAPIWLLITQIHWNDLLRYRKYGSRLVAAMCAHLQAVCILIITKSVNKN